jgi:hypothetical protein
MSLESNGGMILTGKNRRTRRKTCPSATLSTTNPTWIDPDANPDLRGQRPEPWHGLSKSIKNMVMVTITVGIMFLLFTIMHFWCEEFYEDTPHVHLQPMNWAAITESLRNTDLNNGSIVSD